MPLSSALSRAPMPNRCHAARSAAITSCGAADRLRGWRLDGPPAGAAGGKPSQMRPPLQRLARNRLQRRMNRAAPKPSKTRPATILRIKPARHSTKTRPRSRDPERLRGLHEQDSGGPDERRRGVARLVAFLICPAAGFITGTCVPIDRGPGRVLARSMRSAPGQVLTTAPRSDPAGGGSRRLLTRPQRAASAKLRCGRGIRCLLVRSAACEHRNRRARADSRPSPACSVDERGVPCKLACAPVRASASARRGRLA